MRVCGTWTITHSLLLAEISFEAVIDKNPGIPLPLLPLKATTVFSQEGQATSISIFHSMHCSDNIQAVLTQRSWAPLFYPASIYDLEAGARVKWAENRV